MFDISEDAELKEAFSWKNTQPFLKEVQSQKCIKLNFLKNQFIKAYQIMKLNEEGNSETFQWWDILFST